ncbi:extensin family protein [Poseidonocella sedimentorum]|uniref:Uncharacterized conserved protein n=1 Tax=Poseidonocella sedimentorum TaxID=871652 RepID=A0A1I6DXS6_9RHOB|nr:extensin family protein [Poseidonocella sedimentorum]SFR10235.1 Uncharacterized conserved protein [Poseidonocella sedimentorum]
MRLAAALLIGVLAAPAASASSDLRPLMRPDQTARIAVSLVPKPRPPEIIRRAMAQQQARARGAVCGDPDIQGDRVGAIPGRMKGCGIGEAVRVRSVLGVRLSQTSLMDCTTARALKTWIRKGAKPALGQTGGGLAELKVFAHYACRPRNSQPGAKISEHGRGRAIDVGGFVLRDGREISVLEGWNSSAARALRRMHKAACGPFGTVLGPEANRFHRDHFHFDTARYRSGSYCR